VSPDGDEFECEYGHDFAVHGRIGGPKNGDIRDDILSEDVWSLDELREEKGDFLKSIMGDPYKVLKVSAGSQGAPYGFILGAADSLDDLGYNVSKTEEKIFVTPQSNTYGEFVQRKRQAEQNINQTLSSLSDLREQKHMLEHDIRKLRSRAESIREGNETQIKGDFIELVDGAGGGQGSPQGSLDFLRNNNIYPTIVADFNEMRSVEDLKEPDESEFDNPRLYDLPANEKAVLKKKYTMYEKWKDLYGSEIQRKLKELKQQLRNTEQSIEKTKKWLEPYVRDMEMIEHKDREQLKKEMDKIFSFKGYSTMSKEMEFIGYKPVKNVEGNLKEADSEKKATHFKIWYMHAVHVNISGGGNPQTPAEGPTSAKIWWHPAIVCRHVFNNIFKEKVEKSERVFERVLDGYMGEDLMTKEGREFQEAREKVGSIREFRKEVQEKLREMKDDDEFRVPIEFSADVRRIEDGFENPEELEKEYDEDYLEAVDDLLDTEYSEDGDGDDDEESEFRKKLKLFTGQYNQMYHPDIGGELDDMNYDFKMDYYYDFKYDNGMFVMN